MNCEKETKNFHVILSGLPESKDPYFKQAADRRGLSTARMLRYANHPLRSR